MVIIIFFNLTLRNLATIICNLLAYLIIPRIHVRLPRWFNGKEPTCNAGDMGSIPGLGKSLGEGKGNPLQYSCLENPMHRGAWQVIVHGVAEEMDATWRPSSNNNPPTARHFQSISESFPQTLLFRRFYAPFS